MIPERATSHQLRSFIKLHPAMEIKYQVAGHNELLFHPKVILSLFVFLSIIHWVLWKAESCIVKSIWSCGIMAFITKGN